jgi:hypothetical protein
MAKRSREHTSEEFGKPGSGIAGLDAPMIGAAASIFTDAEVERESGVTPGPPGITVKALGIALVVMFVTGVAGLSLAAYLGVIPLVWPPFSIIHAAAPAPRLVVELINESGAALPASSLETLEGLPLGAVPALPSGKRTTVRPPLKSGLSNSLVLTAAGHRYAVVNTLEGNPGGRVTVLVSGKRRGLLTGTVIDASGDRLG